MDSTENQPEASSRATASDPKPNADPPTFKVYKPPRSFASLESRDVPETYFEPTKSDVKLAQNSLHARTEALINAPFKTREMREAADKMKHEKYPTARIRIKFSDRTQLEQTFPSTDKIKSVYAFVRGLLREDVKPIKFVLYQTPPPRELKVSDPKVRDCTLVQLQLAPTAVLHIKFLDDALNHNDIPAPLDPVVLAEAVDLPVPPNLDEPNETPVASTGGGGKAGSVNAPSGEKTKLSSGEAQKKLGKFFKSLGPKT